MKKFIISVIIILLTTGIIFSILRLKDENDIEQAVDDQIIEMQQLRPTSLILAKEKKNDEEILENPLLELQKQYPELVGWITIPDTNIDFPIMQADNNEYFLNHSFDGETSVCGCPFLDYRNQADFSDFNSIVYGHNMSGERIFHHIQNFRDQKYFDMHSNGTLVTETGVYTVQFIACGVIGNKDFAYETVFLTNQQKQQFVYDIFDNMTVNISDVEINVEKDHLIVLSTCTSVNGDQRTVLIGKF